MQHVQEWLSRAHRAYADRHTGGPLAGMHLQQKTIAQHKANIMCATCHAAGNRGSRMRVCERCGRMLCAQCKPPETQCGAKGRVIRSIEEQTGHMNASQRREKEKEKEHEEDKTPATLAGNNGVPSENKTPRPVRQTQERGPAPATMEKIREPSDQGSQQS